jgi:hypothetical protein
VLGGVALRDAVPEQLAGNDQRDTERQAYEHVSSEADVRFGR